MLAAGTVLLLAGPAALTGCAPSSLAPTGPDPLEPPARRAEADAALAHEVSQMAAQVHPALAATARAFSEDRMTHATALRAELHRARPGSATARPPAVPPPAVPPASAVAAAPDVPAARTALTQAARAAQAEAAALVVTLPGYRAALLASVAACCSCHLALLS
ncbi:MAG: hypothetical protein DLM60_17555 [Pseudonocardiales bacterium]|nr:MAG: hypothetical protein DLM60_17555 [Pseudonocardiales bacterium]